jgi:hypothetical protein
MPVPCPCRAAAVPLPCPFLLANRQTPRRKGDPPDAPPPPPTETPLGEKKGGALPFPSRASRPAACGGTRARAGAAGLAAADLALATVDGGLGWAQGGHGLVVSARRPAQPQPFACAAAGFPHRGSRTAAETEARRSRNGHGAVMERSREGRGAGLNSESPSHEIYSDYASQ